MEKYLGSSIDVLIAGRHNIVMTSNKAVPQNLWLCIREKRKALLAHWRYISSFSVLETEYDT